MAIANAVNATETGFQSLDASGVWHGRTLTAGDGVSISNGDGTSGDPTISASVAPIGAMQYFATDNNETYPNPEWLKCDGSIVNQADYPTLFQRVGLINEGGTNLQTVSAAAISAPQYAVNFGGGIFVSVGDSGTINTSTDAITWTSQTSGTATQLRGVVYGNSLHVVNGAAGAIYTSTDAVTWNSQTSGTTSFIYKTIYDGSQFVYCAGGGVIGTSTDGATWTIQTSGTTSSLFSINYLNSVYLSGGINGALITSTDAVTWTTRNSGTTSSILGFWYANSLYHFASGNSDYSMISTSTDLVTWNKDDQVLYGLYNGTTTSSTIIKVHNTYLGAAQGSGSAGNVIWKSNDGLNFKKQRIKLNSVNSFIPYAIAWDGANTIAVVGSGTQVAAYSNVYTYNTATQFKLPTQYFYNNNVNDNLFSNLYIKAL